MEGAGDWVEKALLPALDPYLGDKILAVVADDSRWYSPGGPPPDHLPPRTFPRLREAAVSERLLYLDKARPEDRALHELLRPSVVFVVTPDYTHSAVVAAHLDRAMAVFVEKPFDANIENVLQLLQKRGLARRSTQVFALDHYRSYARHLKRTDGTAPSVLERATEHLGGGLSWARFVMTEAGPVDALRVRSLQFGMVLDLLPHGLAVLAFFGRLDSIDEIRVVEAARYENASISTETFAHVKFTFEDYSGNGWHVPCDVHVGKGLRKNRNYFEVTGLSGNSLVIAFKNTHWLCGSEDRELAKGIYFVNGNDPRLVENVDPARYEGLIKDLVGGGSRAAPSVMPLAAGVETVRALDRIWNAVQAHTPWSTYPIGKKDL